MPASMLSSMQAHQHLPLLVSLRVQQQTQPANRSFATPPAGCMACNTSADAAPRLRSHKGRCTGKQHAQCLVADCKAGRAAAVCERQPQPQKDGCTHHLRTACLPKRQAHAPANTHHTHTYKVRRKRRRRQGSALQATGKRTSCAAMRAAAGCTPNTIAALRDKLARVLSGGSRWVPK